MSSVLSFNLDRVHVEISGPESAPAVVLLHGWGSSAELMRPIAGRLNHQYRIYNVDLPGHGKTPDPPAAWGVPDYANLVKELLEKWKIVPATVIGHSNGGRISLYMASHPGLASLLQRVILISPSGVKPIRTAKYYFRYYTAKILKAPFMVLPEKLKQSGLAWLRGTPIWRMLGSSDYQQVTGVMRETFIKTVNCHLDDVIDQIKIPTLIFRGTADTAISDYQVRKLADNINDAGVIELKNAGHYGYLDDLNTFSAATLYFLENS